MPLTALFFACGGDSNKDAAVYILPNSLKKLNFKEQIYDLILLGQDKEFTDIFKKELKITFINNNTIYEYLEKYLERLSRNEDNGMVIYPYVNNKRIQSQDSFFTLHVDPFKGINKKETNEIIIPANQKKKIRRELTLLGTHEYSIFPDEDGLCKWLKRKHYSDIME